MLHSHTGTQEGNKRGTRGEQEGKMANAFFNNLAFSLVFVLLLLAHFPGQALGEQTKTTEFDVRPGGMVHTFTEYIVSSPQWVARGVLKEAIHFLSWALKLAAAFIPEQLFIKLGGYECSFSFAAQGGTNEKWLMSVGLSDEDKLLSCSVWRPTGTSYLFFTQFKMELKGTKIEYANASSQARAGQKEVVLSAEEYTIGESAVTHTEGKFKAQLAKLTAIGRTRHQEL
nr:myeloid-derived growth factor-like isoform X1 [Nerophis lumbriciformis]